MVAGAKRPLDGIKRLVSKKCRFRKFYLDQNTYILLQKMAYTVNDKVLSDKEKLKEIESKLFVIMNKSTLIVPLDRGMRESTRGLFLDGNLILEEASIDDQDFDSHSGMIEKNPDVWTMQTTESGAVNTSYASDTPGNLMVPVSSTDPLRNDIQIDSNDLQQFLMRSVKIKEYTWNVNSFIRESFFPWEEFLGHPSIRNKLQNYAYISGTLTLTLVINGTQFHYGKGIMSYNPLAAGNSPARAPGSAPVIDNVVYSQRPHVLFDPSDSTGGELILPFVYEMNMIALNTVGGLRALGEITISSLNFLQHALGTTPAPVSVTIFARMNEDVTLAGSTNTPTFVSQAGRKTMSVDKKTEYGDGIISKPASAVARMAGYLKDAPVIGPWAFATQIGAKATSQIASLFGYSRPINVRPIDKLRPTFLGNIANTSVEDATDKLTFDPKQELTIDPRTIGYGSGHDELEIKSIAMRPSYLTRFEWSVSDAPAKHLFSSRLTPMLVGTQIVTPGVEELAFTPMAFAAYPFKYWRGSLKYRFQVVASKFHKGRLRIHYDPDSIAAGDPDWVGGYNEIFDISETKDIEVTIGWNQEISYRLVGTQYATKPAPVNFTPRDGFGPSVNPITPVGTGTSTQHLNGILSVSVLNKLTAPEETSSVEINVFVSACDDFEVAEPIAEGLQALSLYPDEFVSQSGEITGATPQDSTPIGASAATSTVLGNSCEEKPLNNALYFGEAFTTFRDLLKRYNFYTTYTSPTSAGNGGGAYMWRQNHTVFPPYRGETDTGVAVHVKNTLLHYLTPAFATWRGGLRWKYNFDSLTGAGGYNRPLIVTRGDHTAFAFGESALVPISQAAATGYDAVLATKEMPHTWDGSQVTNLAQNPALEVEYPFYAPVRFRRTQDTIPRGFAITTQETGEFRTPIIAAGGTPPAAGLNAMQTFIATGEDFNLMWFVSVPIMYTVLD